MLNAELYDAATRPLERLEKEIRAASPEVREILRMIRDRSFEKGFGENAVALALGRASKRRFAAFRTETGVSVLTRLTLLRMETAAGLLADTSFTVGRIGRLLGYEETAMFRNYFRRVAGHAPMEFRYRAAAARAKAHGERVTISRAAQKRVIERVWEEIWETLSGLSDKARRQVLREGGVQFGCAHFFEKMISQSLEAGETNPGFAVDLARLTLDSVEGSAELLGACYPQLRALAVQRLEEARCAAGGEILLADPPTKPPTSPGGAGRAVEPEGPGRVPRHGESPRRSGGAWGACRAPRAARAVEEAARATISHPPPGTSR